MTEVLLEAGGTVSWNVLLLAAMFLTLGVVFMLAEFVIVSFGVLSACSVGSFVASLYFAYEGGGGWGLTVFIVKMLVLIPTCLGLGLKVMRRTRWGQKLISPNPAYEEVTATGVPQELKALVGKHGVTVTRCRPSGTADIEGQRVDVVAEGMMIELNRPVEVVDVEGGRVVVRQVAPKASV